MGTVCGAANNQSSRSKHAHRAAADLNRSHLKELSAGSERCVSRRQAKWRRMLALYQHKEFPFDEYLREPRRTGKFLRRVKKGPPAAFRWSAWKAVSHITPRVDRSTYDDLPFGTLATMSAIYRDLARTFPHEPFFQTTPVTGLKALEKVLGKLAGEKPRLGYCQGMNFVAGFLLLVSNGDEPGTFAMMQALLNDYQLEGFFSEDMALLKRSLWVFQRLFEKRHPELAEHFEVQGVSLEMWVFQWLLTLFSASLNLEVVVRLWDHFLIDRLTFLHKVALAIIAKAEKTLLAKDVAGITSYFKQIHTVHTDAEALIRDVGRVKVKYAEVKALEQQYNSPHDEPLEEPTVDQPNALPHAPMTFIEDSGLRLASDPLGPRPSFKLQKLSYSRQTQDDEVSEEENPFALFSLECYVLAAASHKSCKE